MTTSLVRLMRIVVGTGVILETGEDTYAHTPSSREYLPGGSVDFFRLWLVMGISRQIQRLLFLSTLWIART